MSNLPAIINHSNIITIDDADWLDHLAENITATIVEASWDIRLTRIMMYWHAGLAIISEIKRQTDRYEADQALPRDKQTVSPPASRHFIFRHVGDRLQHYESFIGTGYTALYDATNFAEMCPTEDALKRTLDRLEAQKNLTWRYICRKLLPGHEDDYAAPPPPTIYYSGPVTHIWDKNSRTWRLDLPPETRLSIPEGYDLHVTLRSA